MASGSDTATLTETRPRRSNHAPRRGVPDKVRACAASSASSSSLSYTRAWVGTAHARARSQTELKHPPRRAEPARTPHTPPTAAPRKSASSPQLLRDHAGPPVFASVYPVRPRAVMHADSEDDTLDELSFTPHGARGGGGVRARRGLGKAREDGVPRGVTTVPGVRGAGETETEIDEGPGGLPTARNVPESAPLIPPHPLEKITPYLFECSRLLSVVPAVLGTLYNFHNMYHPPPKARPSSIDYLVSALWAILTGYQCLALTTGLLSRWRAYYAPLSTLIRLLALQAICWPATHATLTLLGHAARPAACWAAIGSTTCVSRSVQLWVTSNLWDPHARGKGARAGWGAGAGARLGARRWDWAEVGVKCVLPAGVLYFVTAWALILKAELNGC